MARDGKQILWENVKALMDHHYGGENLGKFATKTKVAPATMTRLKKQQTSIGIEIVEAFAKPFGLEAWQLLVPDLQVDNPPVLASQVKEASELYAKIRTSTEALSGLLRIGGNTEPGDLP